MAGKKQKDNEYYRMKAAELEKFEIVTNKIIYLFDNAKQGYSDIVAKSHDVKARATAQNKWKALNDLQHEIEQMLE